MKKLIAVLALVALATGCTTTETTHEEKAYTAGCITAVAWSATEDYLPSEVATACTVAYKVLNVVYGDNVSSDISVAAKDAIADALGDDATESETALVTMLFNIANAKLSPLITEEADKLTLLASFVDGLNATLGVSVTACSAYEITPAMLQAPRG